MFPVGEELGDGLAQVTLLPQNSPPTWPLSLLFSYFQCLCSAQFGFRIQKFFLKWEYVPLDESLFIRYLWNAQWLTLAQHPPLWKVESKTLRFACRRSIREHSQEQHMRRIRKEEFEEKEDELYNECSGDFGWSHRKLWSWVGSSELLKWSKLARTLWLCISQFLEYSFLSHWKLHIRVGLSWAL